jgi:drug/metabolite transporter (DMT)-like permease
MAKLTWLAIAFGGLLLIIQVGTGTASVGAHYFLGILMALAAAFMWAMAALITKRLAGTPPHLIALIQVCVGVIMLAPFADLAHPPAQIESWSILIVIGAVHTGLVYILMYDAIHRLPTHIQGSLSFIYPVVAIAVDIVAFGRHLEPTQLIGTAAILLAVVGMNGYRALLRSRRILPISRDLP